MEKIVSPLGIIPKKSLKKQREELKEEGMSIEEYQKWLEQQPYEPEPLDFYPFKKYEPWEIWFQVVGNIIFWGLMIWFFP